MPPPPPPPPPGPPPPPAPSGPPKLSKTDNNNRSALLGDIVKGKSLKPSAHLTVDKSKPILGSEGKSTNKFGTVSGGLNHNRISGGGPTSSTSTIGPAGGRGGRTAGPPGLADLFGGGMPRLKGAGGSQTSAQQPPPVRLPVQNGYKANAPRPPGPPRQRPSNGNAGVNPSSPPPPPPPSTNLKPSFNNHDFPTPQENLTGRGANGRLSGFGMTPPPPPPPVLHSQTSSTSGKCPPTRPVLPNNKPINIRAPPPPPTRADNKILPPPPPPQDSQYRQGRNAAPPIPRLPGGPPPPPPPVRTTNPPPPPRFPPTPVEISSTSSSPNVPTKDHNLSSSSLSFEMNFKFSPDLPAPPAFRKSNKIYPSVVTKNKVNGSMSRPCPPPPPA